MAIINSELKFYKSKVVSSDSTNGGRMSDNEAVSGVVNNVWPHVLAAERANGSLLHRKLFAKVENDAGGTLISPDLWPDITTQAGDYIVQFAATQDDTQADLTGNERIYYCANLNADVAAGAYTFSLLLEDSTLAVAFVAGDPLRITDKADPESTTGNEELLTISGTPTIAGLVLTVTVSTALANAYTVATGGRAMTLMSVSDIQTSFSGWTETSTSGTYDEGVYPPILDNTGTVYQTVTLTFTDATNFTATSDDGGVTLGSGNTSTDFVPLNPANSKPYFTIEAGGWGGTWAAGETITFTTNPAAAPFWLERTVPAGIASLSGNKYTTAWSGESS